MIWIFPVLVLLTILQSAPLPGLVTHNVRPDLVLILVVGWSTIRGWEEGLLIGLLGGLLRDFTSAAPFGVNAVALGVLGLSAGVCMAQLARTSILLPVLAAALGSLFGFLLSVLGLQAGGWLASWEHALVFQALPSAALTAGLMALAFPLFRAIERRRLAAEDSRAGHPA